MCQPKCNGGLGFRSLHGFNLALLGKHIWKFSYHPSSLVARIFKAKYFPSCNILQAKKGNEGIYIWGGIWEAKEQLCKGFRWVLGDGNTIRMFQHPWLKGKSDFKVEDHHRNNVRDEKMWNKAELKYDMREVECAAEWLVNKLNSKESDKLITITKVLSGIWFARNKKIWEEKVLEASMVMEMSSKQIDAWQEVNSKTKFGIPVKEGDPYFTVGTVIRDEHSKFIMGKNLKIAGCVQVLEAEAYGVLQALYWVQEMNLQQVVIESDSSLVVQALKQHASYCIEAGMIMEDCLSILHNRRDLVVSHSKKHANMVAHNLARIPCLVGYYNLFISPPLCVLEVLSCDQCF
ncbi:hypothetical protein AgCh_008290 [Apium graveolens]